MSVNGAFAVSGAAADGFYELAEHFLVFQFGFLQITGQGQFVFPPIQQPVNRFRPERLLVDRHVKTCYELD